MYIHTDFDNFECCEMTRSSSDIKKETESFDFINNIMTVESL